jgi:AraC-like DNA-binding protein
MKKVVLLSEELPSHLDNERRFRLWKDIYTERFGEAEISCLDKPFWSRSRFSQLGAIGLVQAQGTIQRYTRNARQVAADQREDFLIGIARSRCRFSVTQRGREVVLAQGGMIIYTNSEASECLADGENAWNGVSVPRMQLLERLANAEDMIGRQLDASRPAIRHLGNYVDFLLASDEIVEDRQLLDKLGTIVLDLVVLALGANGDAAEIARGRGLRAARVQEILSEIGKRFCDPGFSAHIVALKLGLSPRYVQELVQETGASFTERVLELRLQRALAMLSAPRHDRMKVSEIALACGFNEVSYFNRRFRARFGTSPSQVRGRGGLLE